MQGAFILVGNNGFGYPLLVVMAIGVFTYAAWRFWEGITGQGSDDAFGPFKNFFRYRLSPLVSVSEQLQGQWLKFHLHLCACVANRAVLSCSVLAVFLHNTCTQHRTDRWVQNIA